MNYTETMEQLKHFEKKAKDAQKTADEAHSELLAFMKENFGIAHGETASISGMINTISKVWDLKKAESNG